RCFMSDYTQVESRGLFELTDAARSELASSKYFNEDLAPTSVSQRTWTTYNITMLWVGMAICLPSLTLSSALIGFGVSPWLAVLNVALGNLIVLIPIQLNSHAGTKYGIPFPAFARMTFGSVGAQIPALLRAFVACGWCAVQSWVGGGAVAAIISVFIAKFGDNTWTMALPGNPAAPVGQVIGFLVFMVFIAWVAYNGMENIKWVQNIGGPILIAVMIALLIWSVLQAKDAGYAFGDVMSQGNDEATIAEKGGFALLYLGALTGNIAFWATMALNIPDFSRYARSQKDQFLGQLIGMPLPMFFCAYIGAFFAQATKLSMGTALFDPTNVFYFVENKFIVFIASIGVIAATITTCVAANVVAPANGISNISPTKISYKKGVIATCIVAIFMQPWWIFGSGAAYVFGWLNNYGIVLAPVAAIFIADYYFFKAKKVDVAALYKGEGGKYWYSSGWNMAALIAWVASFIFPLWANFGSFGFAGAVAFAAKLGTFGTWIAANGYIVSFALAFIIYLALAPIFAKTSLVTEEEHEAFTKRA
ncbi:MAG: NCS1 family nucleobase:cation symporter-1, partial [Anaerovoracaceae bacterium]